MNARTRVILGGENDGDRRVKINDRILNPGGGSHPLVRVKNSMWALQT